MMSHSHQKSDRPVIGIDLGGTNMQIGVVDERNRIVASCRQKTMAQEGLEGVLERIADGVARACAEANIQMADLEAVGIAAPGAIDMPRGIVLEAPNLRWRDVPLRDLLARRLELPVVVENDVNGAVWGEYCVGAARGRGDVLGVWVGTGVGGGLVLNGAIYNGPRYTAGEIGHTIVRPDAPALSRTLEDLASRTGMSRLINDRLREGVDSTLDPGPGSEGGTTGSHDLARAFAAGDALAVEVVHLSASMVGVAIANVITLLALDLVLLGGGVTEALGEPYLQQVRRRFRAEVFPARNRECPIELTALRDNAGLLGASLLARQKAECPLF
jgi:glucokinase